MAEEKLLVIGGDAAGMSAASQAKRLKPELEVEALEMGEFVSYGACGIPYFIAGAVKRLEDLVAVTAKEFEEKRGIKVRLRRRVDRVLPAEKKVEGTDLLSGRPFAAAYDHLLIATGAAPIIPPGINMELPGVFTLRGLAEAGRLKSFLEEQKPRTALVIGGGYLGLEMVEALAAIGLQVTVAEFQDRLMPAMAEEISESVTETVREKGVRIIVGASARAIARGAEGQLEVELSNGELVRAGVVMVAIGVKPRSELARDAGIELGVKGAIKVDRGQRTSAPGVWAAGDCAEAYHALLKTNVYVPLGLTANRQGRVAGANIAGEAEEFPGILGTAVSKIFDLAIARAGLSPAEAASLGLDLEKVVAKSGSRAHYYPGGSPMKILLWAEKDSGRLWGAQMAGKDGVAQRINVLATALAAGLTVSQIYDLDLAYAPPFSPVWDPVLVASRAGMKKK